MKRRSHIKQHVGTRFGSLTVVALAKKVPGIEAARWLCRCDCGKYKIVYGSTVRANSKRSSCGCKRGAWVSAARLGAEYKPRQILYGRKYGRLTVLGTEAQHRHRNIYWQCQCRCGNKLWVSTNRLNRGNTRSCGCLQRDFATNMRGPKHPHYNPEVTNEERKARKESRVSSDSRWKTTSKAVLKRDNYTCLKCKVRGGYLMGHHILPWSKYPELRYSTENCVPLCKRCHSEYHNKYSRDCDDKTLSLYLGVKHE